MIGKSGTFAIYLRSDVSNTATQWDLGKCGGSITLDLNGHTLTLNKSLFHAQAKSTNTLSVTVKNGTIAVGNANVWAIGSKSYGTGKVMNATFTNVKFTSFGTGTIVIDNQEGASAVSSNVTFNDCTLEVNASRTTALIQLGTFESITVNVRINGGRLITNGQTIPTLFSYGAYMSNKSVLLAKGSTGHYLSVTTALSEIVSDGVEIPTAEGVRYFVRSEDADGQSTFTLGEKTSYGYIPEKYLDPTAYPIVVFNVNTGAVAFIPTTLSGEGESSAFQYCARNGGTHAIYIRADIRSADCHYKLGDLRGTILLDLNGHTLELTGKPLFFLQGRDVTDSVVKMYNGTVVQNGSSIVALGGRWGNGKKTNTVEIENVTFQNIKGYLVVDKEYDTVITTTKITFRNCRFELSGASEIVPVTLGMLGDYVRVTVTFVGGEFLLGGTHTQFYTITGNYSYKKVFFEKNAQGQYPTFTNGGVSSSTYMTEDGTPLGLRKLYNTTYVLSPLTIVSAYLNIANDLNLIYRVFLPEGMESPTMTFRVGDRTITVSSLGTDENGYYLFALNEIGPHQMGDTVYASVTATKEGKAYTVSNDTVSIRAYAESLLALYPDDATLASLVEKLLAYGAASQLYTGYRTDALVSNLPTPEAILQGAHTLTLTGTPSELVSFSACGLYLDAAFSLRVTVKADSFDGLTLVAKRGDKTVSYDLSTYVAKDGKVTVYYENLTACDLDENVTFYVTKDGAPIGKTLTFSANAYLYRMQNTDNESLSRLVRTLYEFGVAAQAYTKQ